MAIHKPCPLTLLDYDLLAELTHQWPGFNYNKEHIVTSWTTLASLVADHLEKSLLIRWKEIDHGC